MTKSKAKPGEEQKVEQALNDIAKVGRTQPGCVEFRIFRSAEDPAITVNFECWSSAAERDAFLAGPDVQKFIATVSGTFAESPQPVSYQEADQG